MTTFSAGADRWTNSAQSTLSGGMTAVQTTLPITSFLPFPSGSQSFYRVLVDNEIILVTGGQGTSTWTVVRGVEGTSAAIHSGGAAVTHDVSAFELNSFRQEFNVVAYQAVGDGVADDSTPFQNAVNDAHAHPVGGVVFLPTLSFKVNSNLTTYSNVVFRTYGAVLSGAGAATIAPLIKTTFLGAMTLPGALTIASGGANITGGLTVASGNFSTTGTTTFNTVAYTWPATSGSSGQFLQTNGAGTVSWQTVVSGVTTVTGTANQVSASPTSGAVVVSLPSSGTLPGSWTGATGFTVTTGGLTVTAGGLTVTAGGANITGGITGSLNTAAQPNVTSLGTLTSVTVSGTTTFNNVAYTWPAIAGTNAYVLNTNGSGTLSWAAIPADALSSVSGTANQVTVSPTTGAAVVSLPSGGTLPGAWTAASGFTITTGGLAVTGGISGSGGVNVGNVTGTLQTAAQANVTSLGTLTSLTVSGDTTEQARLVFSAAASKIVPGATSFSHRNNADSADNLLIDNTGSLTGRTWMALGGTAQYTPNTGDLIVNRGGADPGTGLIGFGSKTSQGNYLFFDGTDYTFAKNSAAAGLFATLKTAAQPNVTSLGTLTSLTMGGTLSKGSNALTGSRNASDVYPFVQGTVATGVQIWIQTSDPGGSANNGDLWVNG